MGFYKLREWVWTETGKGDRWEGDSQVGPSPPSEWPAPPHSLHQPPSQGKAGQLHLLAVCCKACAGHFIRRLFAATALSCHALPAHLCHPCLLPSILRLPPFCSAFPAPCSLPCAPGSSRKLQGLPCWQLQHGTALAARAPVVTFAFSPQSP